MNKGKSTGDHETFLQGVPSSGRHASGHIYGLDSLRALAIIGVTLFHMFPDTIRGGYLGVLLFFVLSGYLLAKTCEKRKQQGTWRVLPYYLKRIQRIYPGLLIVLFVTIGVYFFLERSAIAGIRPELGSILFGYNNWWQISQNADYFTRITNASPFTPMWFLAIEIQFYLIWPLIFAIFTKIKRAKGTCIGLRFILILTLLSALLTPILYRPGEDVTRLYYGTDTRIYSLLFGVLLGMLQTRNLIPMLPVKTARKLAQPLLTGILAVICAAYVRMDGQHAFAYRGGMLLMTLLFGVLVLLTTDTRLPVEKWLRLRPLVWIGNNSYEIYLWQYPVIFLFMYKRWGDIPGAPVLEIGLILTLAAWLHRLTDVLIIGKIPRSVKYANAPKRLRIVAAAGLAVFLMISGIAGTAVAPAGKIAQKEQLRQRLAENQKMLQETQGNSRDTPAGGTKSRPAASAEADSEAKTAEELNLQYADREITNRAEVSASRVLMIGDSIMLDAAPYIKEQLPDCHIDAVQNRQAWDSVDLARDLVDDGYLNKTVVISLGTNGAIREKDVRGIMDVFGSNTSVFWINLFGRTVTWEKDSNDLLVSMQKEYPNLSVIDWSGLIRKHSEWLWEDGEHPNTEGSKVYAIMIRESLEAAAAKQ